MKKTATKQSTNDVVQEQTNTIILFGQEIENRKYELREVVQMIRDRFETNGLEVGKMAYYGLAFRHLKLVDGMSYETLSQILIKIFELNGQVTETTAKCMAWYQSNIKHGRIDIHAEFKPSTRQKKTVDVTQLFN